MGSGKLDLWKFFHSEVGIHIAAKYSLCHEHLLPILSSKPSQVSINASAIEIRAFNRNWNSSRVSPILFLIYISGVFNKVSETSQLVTSLSFVDDLGSIALGSSVKEVVKALGKVAKTVLEWGILNAVSYDTPKTEAVLFSKSHRQRLNKQLQETKINVGNEKFRLIKKLHNG